MTELNDTQGPKPPDDGAVYAAYQVSARLLATENTVGWQRLQHLVVLNTTFIGLVLSKTVEDRLTRIFLGGVGILVTVLTAFSLHRTWKQRNLFAANMRELEQHLRLDHVRLGPVLLGREARESKGPITVGGDPFKISKGANHKVMGWVLCGTFVAVYVALLGAVACESTSQSPAPTGSAVHDASVLSASCAPCPPTPEGIAAPREPLKPDGGSPPTRSSATLPENDR